MNESQTQVDVNAVVDSLAATIANLHVQLAVARAEADALRKQSEPDQSE